MVERILKIENNDCDLYRYAHSGYYDNVHTIEIGSGVKTVTARAFSGMSESNLFISEGVERIEEYAFKRNLNLENVVLPESLVSLDPYAFSGCASLKMIACSEKIAEEILQRMGKRIAKENPVVMVISYNTQTNNTSMRLIRGQDHIKNSRPAIEDTKSLLMKIQDELVQRKGMQGVDLCQDFENAVCLNKPRVTKKDLAAAR